MQGRKTRLTDSILQHHTTLHFDDCDGRCQSHRRADRCSDQLSGQPSGYNARDTFVRFQEVTQIESYEDSLQYLSMNDWNVERAVNTALSMSTDAPPTRPERQLPPGTSVTARYMPSYAL